MRPSPTTTAELHVSTAKDGNNNTEPQYSAESFAVKADVIPLTSYCDTHTTLFPENASVVGAGGQCDDGRMSSGSRGDKSYMHLDETSSRY